MLLRGEKETWSGGEEEGRSRGVEEEGRSRGVEEEGREEVRRSRGED